jgi:hypothetical protein
MMCEVSHPLIVFLASFYIVPLIASARGKYSDFWEERRGTLKQARPVVRIGWVLLAIFAAISFPLGFIQRCIVGPTRTRQQSIEAKGKIEGWIVFWALSKPVMLILAYKFISMSLILRFVLFCRLNDLMYVLLRLFILNSRPQNRARSALFLLVHYWEIVVCFACFYLVAQQMAGAGVHLFIDSSRHPVPFGPAEAVRFSFGTATTLGATDIVPNPTFSHAVDYLLYFESHAS